MVAFEILDGYTAYNIPSFRFIIGVPNQTVSILTEAFFTYKISFFNLIALCIGVCHAKFR